MTISAGHRVAFAQQGGRPIRESVHWLKLLQFWQPFNLSEGIAACHRYGYTGLLVKALDGTDWMSRYDGSADAISSLGELTAQVARVHDEGLYYFAWTNPLSTVEMALQATLTGQVARACDGVFLDVEPYCHAQDTEVLTAAGWKRFSEWGGEQVATLSDFGEMEFQSPSRFHAFAYSGPMMHFVGQHGLDALVTPNHDMLAASHQGHGGILRFEKIRAKYVSAEARLLVAPGFWRGNERATVIIPRVEYEPSGKHHNLNRRAPKEIEFIADDWLEFLGYFIAEGYVRAARTPPYEFGLVQKRGTVADRIDACVKRLPIRFSRRLDGDKYRWRANDKSVWTYLKNSVGQGANNKRIPREFLDCSDRQLQILMDALIDGDGSGPSKSGRRAYYSTSRGLLDDVQELGLRLAYRSHIAGDAVAMTERRAAVVMGPKLVDYSGMVYCFTVPNGTLVTRRNGKPLVSGNSQFWGADRPAGLASQFMQWVRLEAPAAFIGLQPDPRGSHLGEIKVWEWMPHVDALAGQHYWSDFGSSARNELAYAAQLGTVYDVPILPTLPGNAAAGSFPFAQIAQLPGFIVWRYGSTPTSTLAELGSTGMKGLVSGRISVR